jgi:DNA-binding transcriptional ArsR family regulator
MAALADPTRLGIVQRLSENAASVTELAAGSALSLRGVLKHVQVLEDAGLVRTEKRGRVRRCQLQPDRIAEASRWLDAVRHRWERRIDRLERYVQEHPEEGR